MLNNAKDPPMAMFAPSSTLTRILFRPYRFMYAVVVLWTFFYFTQNGLSLKLAYGTSSIDLLVMRTMIFFSG